MKKNTILASESFSVNTKRHYFLDFKRAVNDSRYIQFTRSEQQPDGSFKRWAFVVFEDHLEEFISAFSSLFQSTAYQHRGEETLKDMHEELKKTGGIKSMPAEMRPREKLVSKGAKSLTCGELLAILLGSGTPGESVVELADRILAGIGSRLHHLKDINLSALCRYKGMGVAKSCALLAAVELARRLYDCPPPEFKTVYLIRKPGDEDAPVYAGN